MLGLMVPWPLCSVLYSVIRAQGGWGWGGGGNGPLSPLTAAGPPYSHLLAFVLCLQPQRPRIPSGWLWPPASSQAGWVAGKGLRCITGGVWQEGGCHSCLHQRPTGTTFSKTSQKGLGQANLPQAFPCLSWRPPGGKTFEALLLTKIGTAAETRRVRP